MSKEIAKDDGEDAYILKNPIKNDKLAIQSSFCLLRLFSVPTLNKEGVIMSDTTILETAGLHFVGAGKIMYNNFHPDFNMPHLHFLVIRYDEEALYQAVNLELQLFAASNTPENAIAELTALTSTHIITVCNEGRGYEEFMETALEKSMDNYWREYRRFEFTAAKNKQDIGHAVEQRIKNKVIEKLKLLVKDVLQTNADKVEELIDLLAGVPNILYQEAA